MFNKMDKKIFVTQPSLPHIDEFIKIFTKAWDAKWLTNDGLLHKEFEEQLCNYLDVEYISLFNNATIALLIAQKALGFKGQIITTPYSFIATAHSIKWNGLEPVFVDTDNFAGNITPENVENAITEKTGGILAVHNYGIPGNVTGMQKVAEKYELPLIYDAAPCMGVKLKGKSILEYGDLSILSFHATKVFTTFEGGAIVSRSAKMKTKIDSLKNFGIEGPEIISGLGINGKMNEAEAAMGLLQLKYIDNNIARRKAIYHKYQTQLKKLKKIEIIDISDDVEYNYAYFPIIFTEGILARDRTYNALSRQNIICRKYWYPLISDHNIYSSCTKNNWINSRKLSDSVLCLPIYPELEKPVIKNIIGIIEA